MDKDILKGLKIGFGIILSLSIFFGIIYAVGFHSAGEVLSGIFIGNYTFQGEVNFTNNTYGILTSDMIIEFNSTSCPISWTLYEVLATQIAQNEGTPIGDMTQNGGLASAFDGTTSAGYASSAREDPGTGGSNIGKNWGSGNEYYVTRFYMISPSDYYFPGGSTSSGKYYALQGSDDGSSWTNLTTGIITSGASLVYDVTLTENTSTAYQYHRIFFEGNPAGGAVTELIFYGHQGSIRCIKN